MTPRSEIILGDSFEVLKSMADKSVDIALCDCPYGIDICSSGRLMKEKGRAYKPWDKDAPEAEFFTELLRVSKNAIIFGANHFIDRIPINSKCWIVWDKEQPETLSFAMCELALTTFDRSAKIFRYSAARQSVKETRIHPTQKPVALYAWIFQNFANPGNLILDTHLGSGSSRIAAYRMGFDFIGCEIDPEYYTAQEVRFRQECMGEQRRGNVVLTQYELFNNDQYGKDNSL
ncbi:DNA methyltransferase [Muribaculum sp.]|uniref:DNA-methyltransferase n=1 Tax=Muribaculum sp. TaxID=1918611 RepID=UPI00258C11A0|nr:DNA methyltransferase [Muribaculum sp.]MCX4278960.1 DNA methyltransferase [Muribaculum sp.]